ncbi:MULTISPECIES: PAS domain-containing protein [Rhizobium]
MWLRSRSLSRCGCTCTTSSIAFPRSRRNLASAREQEIMATGESIVDFEEPLVQGNGRERSFLTSKVPLRNRHGGPGALHGEEAWPRPC